MVKPRLPKEPKLKKDGTPDRRYLRHDETDGHRPAEIPNRRHFSEEELELVADAANAGASIQTMGHLLNMSETLFRYYIQNNEQVRTLVYRNHAYGVIEVLKRLKTGDTSGSEWLRRAVRDHAYSDIDRSLTNNTDTYRIGVRRSLEEEQSD